MLDGQVLVGPTAEEGIAKEDTKILGRHRSIGNVVGTAETQPAIPQRTGDFSCA